MNSSASCSLSCSSIKTTEITPEENFQGVSKVDDKNEDKTVESICDPSEACGKWTRTRKLNAKWH